MGNISKAVGNPCHELLDLCLRGETWPADLLDRAIALDDGRSLLSIVVERLGDLFEPQLCDVYARLFTQMIARVAPELNERLTGQAGRGRREQDWMPAPQRVYVLSRVTLGADVAVTSVLLDGAKRGCPDAEIVFVGPRKNFELFEGDPRVRHLDAPYARGGTLAERLRASARLWFDDGIVLDPDSRLSQLGLITVCPKANYFLFESRSYGGDGADQLPTLAAQWVRETLGIEGARPYVAPLRDVAPLPAGLEAPDITVSLGVGENPAKGLGAKFESELMIMLAATGASVLVDKGASEEERRRVENVLQLGMRTHDGAFAPFAAHIARSKLFVGYDSAGGHVASASGIPLISIAAGFVSDRMLARWRPNGTVIRGDPPNVLGEIHEVLKRLELSTGSTAVGNR